MDPAVTDFRTCVNSTSDSDEDGVCKCTTPLHAVFDAAHACTAFQMPAEVTGLATYMEHACDGERMRCALCTPVAAAVPRAAVLILCLPPPP